MKEVDRYCLNCRKDVKAIIESDAYLYSDIPLVVRMDIWIKCSECGLSIIEEQKDIELKT